tara:strand:+ start:103 stop:399 length:297 start_codon:yes stop_codon:yes gene_type:complete
MSGADTQQNLLSTESPLPASPVLEVAKSIPPRTLDDLRDEKDALMEKRAEMTRQHNEAIQDLQTQADKLVKAHNERMGKLNTRTVELQGAIKLLSGEL